METDSTDWHANVWRRRFSKRHLDQVKKCEDSGSTTHISGAKDNHLAFCLLIKRAYWKSIFCGEPAQDIVYTVLMIRGGIGYSLPSLKVFIPVWLVLCVWYTAVWLCYFTSMQHPLLSDNTWDALALLRRLSSLQEAMKGETSLRARQNQDLRRNNRYNAGDAKKSWFKVCYQITNKSQRIHTENQKVSLYKMV